MKNKLEKIFALIDDSKIFSYIKIINLILSILAIYYIYSIYIDSYESITSLKIIFNEFIILVLIYLLQAFIWLNYFSNKSSQKKNRLDFYLWCYSNLGKYIPGSIGLFTMRIKSKQIESKKIIFGLIEEQFLTAFIVLPVLIFTIQVSNFHNTILKTVTLVIVYFFIFKKIYFLNNSFKKNSILNSKWLFLINILLQILFIYLVFFNYGIDDFERYANYYLISIYTGLFFIGIPAGLGVREVIFLYLINSSSEIHFPLEIIINIRFLYLFVDLIFGFIGFVNIKFKKN